MNCFDRYRPKSRLWTAGAESAIQITFLVCPHFTVITFYHRMRNLFWWSFTIDALVKSHPSQNDLINESRIYGGCKLTFMNFFNFWLCSSRYKKDFLTPLSKLSQASLVKIFHFSDEWKVVSMAPPWGGHKSWGIYSDILAMASRLNTLYELVDMYNHLDTLESLQQFWGISDTFDVFMTSSMSDLYVILQFFAKASVIKCVETHDFQM